MVYPSRHLVASLNISQVIIQLHDSTTTVRTFYGEICVIISRFGLCQTRVEGDTDRGNCGLDFSHLLAAFLRVGAGEASGAGGGHPR